MRVTTRAAHSETLCYRRTPPEDGAEGAGAEGIAPAVDLALPLDPILLLDPPKDELDDSWEKAEADGA